MEAWKHLRAVIMLPGVVTIVIPGTILWLAGADSFGLWQSVPASRVVLPVIGGLCICLGLLLMVATIRLFVTVGKGTLAPWLITSLTASPSGSSAVVAALGGLRHVFRLGRMPGHRGCCPRGRQIRTLSA